MDKKTKEKLNFKLTMADELLDTLNRDIRFTETYLTVCDDNFAFHKKQYLQKLKFFKNILTCQDSETFHDLTSGRPQIKEVI